MKRIKEILSIVLAHVLVLTIVGSALAMDGWCGSCYPYGDYYDGGFLRGWYKARTPVRTPREAERVLLEFFLPYGDMRIGKVKERELSFEAKIFGRNGVLVDIVIVNKRTGRIRSIY